MLRSIHPVPFDMASMSSGGRDSPELGNSVEVIHAVSSDVKVRRGEERLIHPKLLDAIRLHSSKPRVRPDSPQDSSPHPRNLAEVLDEATLAIRFHAKWFREEDVAHLLETALDATFESSSTAEVSAAIHLIDNVLTYSYIPPTSVPRSVRFIAQQYYNSKKARKTKDLAKQVRTTLLHILGSHLGDATLKALLDVVGCEDASFLVSRTGHAQTAGALMIIFQKLWLKEDVRDSVPTPDLLQLIASLQYPAQNGGDSLLDQILETLAALMNDERAIAELVDECSWDVLIDVVRLCIDRMTKSHNAIATATAAVDSLCRCIPYLEDRHIHAVADLATVVGRPPSEVLSNTLTAHWPPSLPTESWLEEFPELLRRLAHSSSYQHELGVLGHRFAMTVGLPENAEHTDTALVAQLFRDCILELATPAGNAGVLATVLVELLLRLQIQDPESEPKVLFDTICLAAERTTEAVKFMLRIRSDVENALYIEQDSQDPAAPDREQNQAVFIKYLSLQQWERTIINIMESETLDWSIYDCLLQGLPELLANHALFEPRIQLVRRLSVLLCRQLDQNQYNDPPAETGLTKSYIAANLVRVLTAIVTYHRQLSKQELLDVVSAFVKTAGSRDYIVSIPCVYALTICCYEIPDLMSNYMDDVIDKMSKMVTQRFVAIHVLEFLAGLSRLPELVRNFQRHDYKKIFGVCGSYLQSIRVTGALSERHWPSNDRESKASSDTSDALPQYVYALAHHVMIFWYLILRPDDRPELQKYIMSCLRYKTADGNETVEDQGLVTIDIIDRVNAGDYRDDTYEPFTSDDGRLTTRQLIAGILLISTETALRTGSSLVTVRRPSGTTLHLIKATHKRSLGEAALVGTTIDTSASDFVPVVMDDPAGQTYGRISIPRPQSLLGASTVLNMPREDEAFASAIRSFDRVSALDSHKAGVIYVGERQKTEDDILSNHMGSPDYVQFVEGLGTLTRLKGARFNTQGLDRGNDEDGKHAVVWHNDVTELVFHVTTLMPTDEDVKLNTARKKRHTGNDFVNIVFNNSGAPFNIDTFPSQFSTVWIVIAPSARTTFLQTRMQTAKSSEEDRAAERISRDNKFYRVQILSTPGYPNIGSAAAEKVISGASLPAYVRNLALNECIFSAMWSSREQGGEYQSSWRNRLHQIRRMRERFGGKS